MTVTNLLLTVPIFPHFFLIVYALKNGRNQHKYRENSIFMLVSVIQYKLRLN